MRFELFDVPIDDLTKQQFLNLLDLWVREGEFRWIATPNPEIVLAAKSDRRFLRTLKKADLFLPDGFGVILARVSLTGKAFSQRLTGSDSVISICRLAEEKGYSVLMLGGEVEESSRGALKNLRERFPALRIDWMDPGIVSVDRKGNVQTSESFPTLKADIVFVALGQKKQEYFIESVLRQEQVKVAMTVGGAFDMISDYRPRAPRWMQRVGLEWLWRVFIEPTRIKRIFRATVVFPFYVILDTIRRKRFMRACAQVTIFLILNLWKKHEQE